ncbi:MAG: GNA1162 family protein [Pseudomonadota bacterium]
MKILIIGLTLMLAGCVTPPAKYDMSAFQAAAPRSILVVPMVNRSLDLDAPNYVLSTLPIPLAEKGYYVFPVNTTKYVLEQEGMYEADRIHAQPTESLAKLFGADAVLYITINRWDAQYAFITTTVTVDFDYRIVSKDGTEIWKAHKTMQYTPQNSNTGLLGAIISAALARATPNYMPLAQQANRQVFVLGENALPDGPYLTNKAP